MVLGLPAVPPFPVELAYEAGAVDVLHEPLVPAVLHAKARFFIEAFRNASERRQAEAALVDTRARLEATIAAAELAVWSWDVQADRVCADPAMARLFGVSAHDADGGPLAAYFDAIHPEDVDATRAVRL